MPKLLNIETDIPKRFQILGTADGDAPWAAYKSHYIVMPDDTKIIVRCSRDVGEPCKYCELALTFHNHGLSSSPDDMQQWDEFSAMMYQKKKFIVIVKVIDDPTGVIPTDTLCFFVYGKLLQQFFLSGIMQPKNRRMTKYETKNYNIPNNEVMQQVFFDHTVIELEKRESHGFPQFFSEFCNILKDEPIPELTQADEDDPIHEDQFLKSIKFHTIDQQEACIDKFLTDNNIELTTTYGEYSLTT